MNRELLERTLIVLAGEGCPNAYIKSLIDDIEKELANPDPEPVGWLWQSDNYSTTFSQRLFHYKLEADSMKFAHGGALYPVYTVLTAQQKPLTDEEILVIFAGWEVLPIDTDRELVEAARSIEKAHGIGVSHE